MSYTSCLERRTEPVRVTWETGVASLLEPLLASRGTAGPGGSPASFSGDFGGCCFLITFLCYSERPLGGLDTVESL